MTHDTLYLVRPADGLFEPIKVVCSHSNFGVIGVEGETTVIFASAIDDDGWIRGVRVAGCFGRICRSVIAVVIPDTVGRIATAMFAICIENRIRRVLRTVQAAKVRSVICTAENHQFDGRSSRFRSARRTLSGTGHGCGYIPARGGTAARKPKQNSEDSDKSKDPHTLVARTVPERVLQFNKYKQSDGVRALVTSFESG